MYNNVYDWKNFSLPWITNVDISKYIDKYSDLGIWCNFKKSDFIIFQGDNIDRLYFMKTGIVKSHYTQQSGEEKIIWFAVAPTLIGVTSFFNRTLASAQGTVIAYTDCEAISFSIKTFKEILLKDSDFHFEISSSLAVKVDKLIMQMDDMLSTRSETAVCRFLYLIVNQFLANKKIEENKSISIALNLTQNDIAQITTVHRITVNKTLKRLGKEGVLTIEKNGMLHVFDMQALYENSL